MAEDIGDKTEAPTPKRRLEARERGNIARSQDLTAAVLLLGFWMLMQSFGPGLIKALRAMVNHLLSIEVLANVRPDGLGPAVWQSLLPVALALAPMLLGAMLIAVIINILQVGLYFNTKRLQPNLAAMNPLRGAGKMFKGPGLVKMVMNILKMTLMALVAWSAIYNRLDQVIGIQMMTYLQAFGLASDILFSVAIRIGVVLLILALIDYVYQKIHFEKELRMTKQEVKEEMRSMDGDPKIKARRRQIALQMLQNQLKKSVPTADVVVTNPTHYAVALKYDAAAMHAPRVIAKGQDIIAQRIREIAVASGVPILERKPLARALYKLVDVGQEIPEQFYAAVAEILAYVYELTGKLKKRADRTRNEQLATSN